MVAKSRGAAHGTDRSCAHPPPRRRNARRRSHFLKCDPTEAVRIALAAAGARNLGVFSPAIGAQLLELELIDEIDIHIAPILLGDGIQLYHSRSSQPIRLHPLDDGDLRAAVRLRYRPAATARIGNPG
jgi:hypothetical protein